MKTESELRAELAQIRLMRRGEIPADLDPFSPEGQLYIATMRKINRDLARAPRMTLAQKVRVATLLKGGRHAR